MSEQFFYRLDPRLIAVILAIVFIAVAEIGYQVAKRYGSQNDASQFEAIQSAIFGLLALLLAFTFSAASSRYDTRRAQVVSEANAIGTAYLRAQTLPAPYRTQATDLIREYVDVQLSYFSIKSLAELDALVARTSELQTKLWSVTEDVAVANRDSVVVGLYEASVNEAIDMQTNRLAVFLNRVPETIWRILSLLGLVAFFIIGHLSGLGRRRNVLAWATVAVMVALVITMIVDLDRSLVGPTRVSPKPLIDLRTSIQP